MLLDLLIIGPLIIFTVLGTRDGIVRKLVACVAMLAGLILGHFFMRSVGEFLIASTAIDPANGPLYGFLTIFLSISVIQGILYKVLANGYKLKGVADRIGGTVVGFFEGFLFLSCILYIFALSGVPSRRTSHDSRLYKPVVNLAPQILDFVSVIEPELMQKFKNTRDGIPPKNPEKE
jgi:uncharacterized membrane protein required for colicin V production